MVGRARRCALDRSRDLRPTGGRPCECLRTEATGQRQPRDTSARVNTRMKAGPHPAAGTREAPSRRPAHHPSRQRESNRWYATSRARCRRHVLALRWSLPCTRLRFAGIPRTHAQLWPFTANSSFPDGVRRPGTSRTSHGGRASRSADTRSTVSARGRVPALHRTPLHGTVGPPCPQNGVSAALTGSLPRGCANGSAETVMITSSHHGSRFQVAARW